MRCPRTLLAALCVVAATAGALAARALAGDDLDTLQALDRALPRAVEKAQASVLPLLVEREERDARPLTQREKISLGLSEARIWDPRYFARPEGACSAVVLRSEKGKTAYLVTALWNVRDDKSISILLPDGSTLPATQRGRDENLDIALLEVPENPALKPIALAPEASVGQFAILVGRGGDRASPVVTWGNVSALGRHKGDAVQVTTRMNYGNVGGAVVDLEGRLLGIAARLTDRPHQGLNSGVGFAAPVARILGELGDLASGKVVPKRKVPFFGIKRPDRPRPLPEGVERGVIIDSVVKGGAAERSGILGGDVIKIFNGVEVDDFGQLRDEIERLEVGEKVIVTVFRPGKGEKDFTIELGGRDDGGE